MQGIVTIDAMLMCMREWRLMYSARGILADRQMRGGWGVERGTTEMGRYAIRRVLLLIPTLLAVYTISFLLIHATPGGPWDEADKPLTAEQLAALNAKFGTDKPLWRQYSTYLWNVLHGDFGPSF